MAANDAQATTITFDGTEIGGFVSFNFLQGVAREVLHRPIGASVAVALPGQPDYGRCTMSVYFDKQDPGQVKLRDSWANRLTRTVVISYSDGTTDTFDAFCLLFPMAGSKDQTNPVNTSTVTLRVCGPIT